jgi:hypothetical protein
LIRQMIAHVHVYAELLFRWQMYEKRIQLLKIMSKRKIIKEEHKGMHYRLGKFCFQLFFSVHRHLMLFSFQALSRRVHIVDDLSTITALNVMHAMYRELWLYVLSVDYPSKVRCHPRYLRMILSYTERRSLEKLPSLPPYCTYLVLGYIGSADMPYGMRMFV